MTRASLGLVAVGAAVAALLVAATGAGGAQSRWTVTLLPLPAGARQSEAAAINDVGMIAGWADARTSPAHVVVWRRGRPIDLGAPPLGGGLDMPNAGRAVAINDRGDVAGTGWVEQNDPRYSAFVWRSGVMTVLPLESAVDIDERGRIVGNRGRRAFLWDRGRVTEIRPLRAGRPTSVAAINDRGQVVGKSGGRAFLWERGGMRELGTLGGRLSSPVAINERGQVVGTSTTRSGREHAFLWSGGRMRDLGVLPRMRFSKAIDVNERGEVLCTTFASYDEAVAGSRRAFVWRGGRRRDLGTLGGRGTAAHAINDRGQVVGSSATSGGAWRGFVWDNGRMTALGSPSGWSAFAHLIDNRGRVAGRAWRGDRQQAVAWTPRG